MHVKSTHHEMHLHSSPPCSLQIHSGYDRSLTESPPYSASFHLVTPGPDVIVSSSDHSLRAAALKAFKLIDEKIEQRQTKRSLRREAAPAIELTRRHPSGSPRR